jgi:(2Fe-2S) ferredoxin
MLSTISHNCTFSRGFTKLSIFGGSQQFNRPGSVPTMFPRLQMNEPEIYDVVPGQIFTDRANAPILKGSQGQKHIVECCNGSNCFVNGKFVQKVIEKATGDSFQKGGSPDGEFALVQIGCLGECRNTPWIRVDGVKYVRLTENEVFNILQKVKSGKEDKICELYVRPIESESIA